MTDVETFNMGDFKRQFDALVKENDRLNYLKTKYIEHSEIVRNFEQKVDELKQKVNTEMDELKRELHKLSINLDPVSTMNRRTGKRMKKSESQRIMNELYDKMKAGVQMTTSLIEKTYDNLEPKQSYSILKKLKNCTDVKVARDGIKIRLYI